MNIVYVITGLGMGGAETQVCNLADEFSKLGNKVTIIYLTGDEIVTPSNPNINIIPLCMEKSILSTVKGFIKLSNLIKRIKPDVVHSHMIHANILIRLSKLFSHIPKLICTAHNTNEGGLVRMLCYRVTDRFADISTNVSSEAVDAFITKKAVPSGRMIAIPNGIDTFRFSFDQKKRDIYRKQFDLKEDVKVIIAVGRLHPQKDYPNLLNAISILLQKKAKFKVLIVGDGSLKTELMRNCSKLGLNEIVTFVGIFKDIPGIMSASDVFVLPSLYEGFGLVVAEAMSCERAVVVTDCGGVSEVVGDKGLLVKPNNSEELANGLLTLLELESDELAALGEKGRKRIIDNFSIANTVNSYLELYQA